MAEGQLFDILGNTANALVNVFGQYNRDHTSDNSAYIEKLGYDGLDFFSQGLSQANTSDPVVLAKTLTDLNTKWQTQIDADQRLTPDDKLRAMNQTRGYQGKLMAGFQQTADQQRLSAETNMIIDNGIRSVPLTGSIQSIYDTIDQSIKDGKVTTVSPLVEDQGVAPEVRTVDRQYTPIEVQAMKETAVQLFRTRQIASELKNPNSDLTALKEALPGMGLNDKTLDAQTKIVEQEIKDRTSKNEIASKAAWSGNYTGFYEKSASFDANPTLQTRTDMENELIGAKKTLDAALDPYQKGTLLPGTYEGLFKEYSAMQTHFGAMVKPDKVQATKEKADAVQAFLDNQKSGVITLARKGVDPVTGRSLSQDDIQSSVSAAANSLDKMGFPKEAGQLRLFAAEQGSSYKSHSSIVLNSSFDALRASNDNKKDPQFDSALTKAYQDTLSWWNNATIQGGKVVPTELSDEQLQTHFNVLAHQYLRMAGSQGEKNVPAVPGYDELLKIGTSSDQVFRKNDDWNPMSLLTDKTLDDRALMMMATNPVQGLLNPAVETKMAAAVGKKLKLKGALPAYDKAGFFYVAAGGKNYWPEVATPTAPGDEDTPGIHWASSDAAVKPLGKVK